jgi:DNA-binding winged helix-turn-helix (wHTH) protein
MGVTKPTASAFQFGVFELDLKAGELRKQGIKVKLQEQPFQVLATLLEHAGEVVTKDELQQQIWAADTFVDFDHGLHSAITRLREALGDSSESPRFIETIPGAGTVLSRR